MCHVYCGEKELTVLMWYLSLIDIEDQVKKFRYKTVNVYLSHYNQPMPSIKAASGIDACDIEYSVEKYE